MVGQVNTTLEVKICRELSDWSVDDSTLRMIGTLRKLQPIVTFLVAAKLLVFITIMRLLVCNITVELGNKRWHYNKLK